MAHSIRKSEGLAPLAPGADCGRDDAGEDEVDGLEGCTRGDVLGECGELDEFWAGVGGVYEHFLRREYRHMRI